MAVTICQRYHVNVYLSKLYHVRILLYVHMYLYTACKYTKILLVGIALPKHHFLKRFIFLSKRPAPTTNDSNRRASSLNLPISRLDSPLAPPTTNVQGPILSTVNLGLEDSPIDYVMIYIYIHVYVHAYIYIVAIWWLEFKIRSLHWIYQPMYMESGNARRGLSAPSVLGVPGRPETYCSDIPSIKSLRFIGKFVLKEICDFHNLSHHSQSSRKNPPWSPAMRKSKAFNRFDVSW